MYRKASRPGTHTISNYAVITARKLFFSLSLLTLLCIMSISTVPASTLPSTHDVSEIFSRSVDLYQIGYRTQWQQLLHAQAKQAADDNAPYLVNRLLELLAQDGDRDAAFRLGLFYDVGEDEARDAKRAVYWYKRAAAAGEIHALHNLGVAYANGDGVVLDINMAIKWWTLAASLGNADSQYNLGILYAMGEYGIKKDIDQAKHWWRKAAMHGDPMAQYNLGTLYVNNDIHDYCEATRWWEEAARNGLEQASLALRVIKSREDYHDCR